MIYLPEVECSDRGDGDLHLLGSGMTRPIIASYLYDLRAWIAIELTRQDQSIRTDGLSVHGWME
jgi:hypothetical protein